MSQFGDDILKHLKRIWLASIIMMTALSLRIPYEMQQSKAIKRANQPRSCGTHTPTTRYINNDFTSTNEPTHIKYDFII